MSKAIFVDASAWIGIINRRDGYHQTAQWTYRGLLEDGIPLLTTTWTAYEALSLIKARIGYGKMAELWEVLNDPGIVKLVRVSRAIEDAGLDIFFRYRDKAWGVVDCTSIAAMRLLNCRKAFAFDQHFREAGQQSGLEIIPAI